MTDATKDYEKLPSESPVPRGWLTLLHRTNTDRFNIEAPEFITQESIKGDPRFCVTTPGGISDDTRYSSGGGTAIRIQVLFPKPITAATNDEREYLIAQRSSRLYNKVYGPNGEAFPIGVRMIKVSEREDTDGTLVPTYIPENMVNEYQSLVPDACIPGFERTPSNPEIVARAIGATILSHGVNAPTEGGGRITHPERTESAKLAKDLASLLENIPIDLLSAEIRKIKTARGSEQIDKDGYDADPLRFLKDASNSRGDFTYLDRDACLEALSKAEKIGYGQGKESFWRSGLPIAKRILGRGARGYRLACKNRSMNELGLWGAKSLALESNPATTLKHIMLILKLRLI